MPDVQLRRTVSYETLEKVLLKSAKEVNLKGKVKDVCYEAYQLGSVTEIKNYHHTEVRLKGRIFPAMRVHIPNKQPTNWFYLFTGMPFGVAGKRKIEHYLEAVSKNLSTVS